MGGGHPILSFNVRVKSIKEDFVEKSSFRVTSLIEFRNDSISLQIPVSLTASTPSSSLDTFARASSILPLSLGDKDVLFTSLIIPLMLSLRVSTYQVNTDGWGSTFPAVSIALARTV